MKLPAEIPKKIVKAVKNGMGQPFWRQGLRPALEGIVNVLTDKITGDIPMDKDETREELLLKRRAFKDLLELPETILEDSGEVPPEKAEEGGDGILDDN